MVGSLTTTPTVVAQPQLPAAWLSRLNRGPNNTSSSSSSSSSSSILPNPPSPNPNPLITLPPGHFLALPPTFATDTSLASLTTSHGVAPGLAPNVASLAAADFDVDVRTGFLPSGRNIERLPKPWDIWEDALDGARGEGVGNGLKLGPWAGEVEKSWRKAVGEMEVVSTDGLRASLPLLRRAHLILTFLLHFYVHSKPPQPTKDVITTSAEPCRIPASIAVPLLTVSSLVGLPPILTYADTVLYNYLPYNPDLPTTEISNPPTTALMTFTNTISEEQFYVISAECEIAGVEALKLMRQSMDELFLGDEVALGRLTGYLARLAVVIDRIGETTLKMMKNVDPEEFYHLIRPWFRGGDADGPDGPGWLFEGIEEDEEQEQEQTQAENPLSTALAVPDGETRRVKAKKLSGPSAGQSSLIHAIDIFLTVDHSEREEEVAEREQRNTTTTTTVTPSIRLSDSPVSPPSSSTTAPPTPAKPAVEATFLQRMLQYMPQQHRTFLTHLSISSPTTLRALVIRHAQTHPQLVISYDLALSALKRFRDRHMRVATMFIVQQARRKPSERILRMLGHEIVDEEKEVQNKVEEKGSGKKEEVKTDQLRGTGGTPLVRFLKRCRDNTSRAMIGSALSE